MTESAVETAPDRVQSAPSAPPGGSPELPGGEPLVWGVVRTVWVHGGLPLAAFLLFFLCNWIGFLAVSWQHDFPVVLALFWIFPGIRALFTAWSGNPDGAWVPRRFSLVTALLIHFGAWIGLTVGQWDLQYGVEVTIASELLIPLVIYIVAFPAVMILHAKGARARTGSALFGWLIALPMIGISGRFVMSLVQASFGQLQTGQQVEGHHFQLLMAAVEPLGFAFGLVLVSELLLTSRFPRRGKDQPGADSSRGFSPLVGVAVAGVPFLLALPLFSNVQGQGFLRGMWNDLNLLYLTVSIALPILTVMGLVFGLWCVSKSKVRERGSLYRTAVYVVVISGALVFAFHAVEAARVKWAAFLWPLAALGLILFADWADGRREEKARREGAGEGPGGETAALRALTRFVRSPLGRWGISRRRSFHRIMPLLLWIFAFAALVAGILVGTRGSSRPVTLATLFSPRYYGPDLGRAYLLIVYGFGVAVPLAVLIPWRIAARFQQVWEPIQLRELALTRLGMWDIFWGVILPPARSMLYLAGTTVLFLIPLALGLNTRGHYVYLISPDLLEGLFFLLVPIVIGVMLSVLTIGFARRGKRAGIAAYGAAVLTMIAAVAGFVALLAYFDSVRLGNLEGIAVLLLPIMGILWAFRRAFTGVPETLELLVGE